MEGRNNRILEIDSLAIYFGGLKAIDGVSLYIEKNDFLGLIGPNGAGKSTLFNAITGNIVPTMGTIAFNNTVINKKRPYQICHLGISRTFQNIRLFPKMTAIENVSIGMNSIPKYSLLQAAIRSGKVEQINRETIDQAYYYLDLLGIAGYKDNLAGSLPYGLQRRLEIARAIATKPELLLLDEPAAGMNNDECNELVEVLKKIHNELGFTVALIEHHIDFVMNLCNRLYVLNLGKILAEGTPEAVQNDPNVIKAYLGERRNGRGK